VIIENRTRRTIIADDLEIARSFWARFRGPMGRHALAPGSGLLLAGNGIHMFFMRFPIDAVFLGPRCPSGEWDVVAVREGLRPWRGVVPYVQRATAVLELPVGAIRSTGTVVGDVIALWND
jgi:uncharacterized membrane protein (UPF0127 family)